FDFNYLEYDATSVEQKLLNIVWPPRSYDDYTNARGISRARKFMDAHASDFKTAHQKTGVSPSVVAAILSIETNFAKVRRKHRVLKALTSLAALSVEDFGAKEEARVAKRASQYKGWTSEISSRWHERREKIGADWYLELKTYLAICDELHWKPQRYL